MPSLDWLLHDPRRLLLFPSEEFLLLFSVFVALWATLRSLPRWRLAWLLCFSYYYYYRCNGLLVLVLCGLTAADWALGLRLGRMQGAAARRLWLIVGIGLNLSLLGFFKYAAWLLSGITLATGMRIEPFALFLPVGISFHVLQSVGYLVDVYRRRLEPTASLFEVALFLSFFPQLVAGPIVRAEEFLPQIRRLRDPDPREIAQGLFRVMLGVAKKALLADYLGRYVDLVVGAPRAYSGVGLLLGVYAYAAQIYLDFSGYSDMALGFARMLGVRLRENFDSPYRATSITEFWRRWHISLSSWLRDYLYIPLGGNRRGKARSVLNLTLTMLIGGLWHGASWTFVAWGGLHGLGLAVERVGLPSSASRSRPWRRALGWVATFHVVAVLWVLFRAPSFEQAGQIFASLLSGWDASHLALVLGMRRAVVAAVAVGLAVSLAPSRWQQWLEARFGAVPWPAQALLLIAVLEASMLVSSSEIAPFIYFQF